MRSTSQPSLSAVLEAQAAHGARAAKRQPSVGTTPTRAGHWSATVKLDISPVNHSRPSAIRPPSAGLDIHARPPAIEHRKAPSRPGSAPSRPGSAPSSSSATTATAQSPACHSQYLVWPRAECAGQTSPTRGRVGDENVALASSSDTPTPSLFFEGIPAEVAIPREMAALSKANLKLKGEHDELRKLAEEGKAASAAAKIMAEQLHLEQAARAAAKANI